jgi:hypothetical protein
MKIKWKINDGYLDSKDREVISDADGCLNLREGDPIYINGQRYCILVRGECYDGRNECKVFDMPSNLRAVYPIHLDESSGEMMIEIDIVLSHGIAMMEEFE